MILIAISAKFTETTNITVKLNSSPPHTLKAQCKNSIVWEILVIPFSKITYSIFTLILHKEIEFTQPE